MSDCEIPIGMNPKHRNPEPAPRPRIKPSETMRFLYHAGSPQWHENYPAHFENYKKLLVLAEAVELWDWKGEKDRELIIRIIEMADMMHIAPILRAALALNEKP